MAPVPILSFVITNPDGVVMVFPVVWAGAVVDGATARTVANVIASKKAIGARAPLKAPILILPRIKRSSLACLRKTEIPRAVMTSVESLSGDRRCSWTINLDEMPGGATSRHRRAFRRTIVARPHSPE